MREEQTMKEIRSEERSENDGGNMKPSRFLRRL